MKSISLAVRAEEGTMNAMCAVVTAAKWFGVGCALQNRSLLTRCGGALIALACSMITGFASWVIFLEWPHHT